MRPLSKTKLLAYRQCPKRLWLEIHRPELRQDSAGTQANFDAGHEVGRIARQLYDPHGKGQLIDLQADGFDAALARSRELLTASRPVFEAGFAAGGALAFADVMLPAKRGGKRAWRMIEVKSSASLKDYHRDDAAIQSFVARKAGISLASIVLAHVDSNWVYPGGGEYQGLLKENDLTEEACSRDSEVMEWIADAQATACKRAEPEIGTGRHCGNPYACGFLPYCQGLEPQARYPAGWLPRIQSKGLKALIEEEGVTDLRDVPDSLLNDRQLRVKRCTLSNKAFFDAAQAAIDLAVHKLPAYFLDFETIMFAAPIWKGTRPYQQIPFQFSVHVLSRSGKLSHQSFLDLSGNDPSKALAEALIAALGERGPVFVYNEKFEKGRIGELGERFPRMRRALMAINERIVDLMKVAEAHYYHPSQQGSWSIKKVLPAAVPDPKLRYDSLSGVQDGGMAMSAYLQATSPAATGPDRARIEKELLEYCWLDTYGMVRLWQFFSGRSDLKV